MAFKFSNSDDTEGLSEINIIPLVDVMLVLLIIFMVAAPLSVTGIKINLPASKAKGATIEKKRIVLSIDRKGEYFISRQKVSKDLLRGRLHQLFRDQKNKVLYIRADRDNNYGNVVDAMGVAKLAGVEKISMLTRPYGNK